MICDTNKYVKSNSNEGMAENMHTNIEDTDQCLKSGFLCFQDICVHLKVKNTISNIRNVSCNSFDLHEVIIGLENHFRSLWEYLF